MSSMTDPCSECGRTISRDTNNRTNGIVRGSGFLKMGRIYCCEGCARKGEAGHSESISNSSSNSGSSSGVGSFLTNAMKSDEEKMAEQGLSGEDIAKITREKAAAQLELEKLAIERRKEEAIEEEKAAAKRKIKADIYRQQGKHFIGWLVELNPYYLYSALGLLIVLCFHPVVTTALRICSILTIFIFIILVVKDAAKISWKAFGIVIGVLIAGIVGLLLFNQHRNSLEEAASATEINKLNQHADSVSKAGNEFNLKLEGVEDQVKLAITDGNREKALALANQLIHPMHEQWKNESKYDRAKGYPYFDEYWSQKRQEYKDKIISMPNNAVPVQVNQAQTDTATIKQDTKSLR